MLRSRRVTSEDPSIDLEQQPSISSQGVVVGDQALNILTTKGQALILWLCPTAVLFFFASLFLKLDPKPLCWWECLIVLWIPVGFVLAVAAGWVNALPHQRLVAAAASIAILGNQIPRVGSVVMVCTGMTLFSLSSRPDGTAQSTISNQHKLKAAYMCLLAVAVFICDNFCVWAVAATYKPSHKGLPEPLQDNGQLLVKYLLEVFWGLGRRMIVQLRGILNVQWAVVASAGASFAVIEMGMVVPRHRTLGGVLTRTLLTIAILRTARIISYMMTVLPSQNPNCYRQRFPPPPQDWHSWILVGLRAMAHGGCNDLIISGHSTVITTLACMTTSISGHWLFSVGLWTLIAIDYSFETYEGFHYSVDMWMGALIGTLIWRSLGPSEDVAKDGETQKLLPLSSCTRRDVILYSAPAILAFVVNVILPRWMGLYWVIAFLLFATQQIIQHKFSHYVQHCLFCLLFMALFIFL